MGILDTLADIAEAFTDPSPQGRAQSQQVIKPLPTEKLNMLLNAGKRGEAVNLLSKYMGWSHARAVTFINELENTQTESKFTVHRSAKKHTSLDVLLSEQAEAEAKAGGNLFYYFLGKFR